MTDRPIALVTGVGRTVGIGAAIATRLAGDGWDVAISYWSPYDARVHGHTDGDVESVVTGLRAAGAATIAIPADLSDVDTPARLFDAVGAELGPVTALVMAHCESVDSDLFDTTVESFDRHYAVNTRATWLLIKLFAERFVGEHGRGRIVALTSDATVGNIPYGATKGALDRVVLAAARELGPRGITSNAINPGPIDTGWMSDELRSRIEAEMPLGRGGRTSDTASLVSFLCSSDGGWINGQLLQSDGGLHT